MGETEILDFLLHLEAFHLGQLILRVSPITERSTNQTFVFVVHVAAGFDILFAQLGDYDLQKRSDVQAADVRFPLGFVL